MKYYKVIISLLFVTTHLLLADPVQITVQGTADWTDLGYVSNEEYSFSWVVNDIYTQNTEDGFKTNSVYWYEETISDSPMFSSISGNGISGTLSRPTVESNPFSYLHFSDDSNLLSVSASTDDPSDPIGLFANGHEIKSLQAFNIDIGPFTEIESPTNPAEYFADYAGTYTITNYAYIWLETTDSSIMMFTVDRASIEVIPEPSSIALITVAGLFVGLIRRYLAI